MPFISNFTLYQLQGNNTKNNCINCLKNIKLITICSYGQSTETVLKHWIACHTAENTVAVQRLMMPPTQQCCQWQKDSPYHIRCQRIYICSFSYDSSIASSKVRSSAPLSVYSIVFSPQGHIADAYVFFLVFPSYVLPSIFSSKTCLIRQFLRKMWPIQLALHKKDCIWT